MEADTSLVLRAAVAPFETPSLRLGVLQIVTSIGFYLATIILMYWSLRGPYWVTLGLAFAASGFLVRTFIVQHDCGHGSFFRSQRANDLTGTICSILTLAPYWSWRRQHSQHHANWNNLDRRESGADIYSSCLTVTEYRSYSRWKRLLYRMPRHPAVAHLLFPPLIFILLYRFPFDMPKSWTAERRSVVLTNFAVLFCGLALGFLLGFRSVLLVHLPVITITTIVGVWLFSVQHRFETAQWLRKHDWTFYEASLKGTSYLKLPKVLQWVTGNIGFHHIHHLAPRVPNYSLEACYANNPILREGIPQTLQSGLRAIHLSLWDETQKKLVSFKGCADLNVNSSFRQCRCRRTPSCEGVPNVWNRVDHAVRTSPRLGGAGGIP